jgi:hypothetical protein
MKYLRFILVVILLTGLMVVSGCSSPGIALAAEQTKTSYEKYVTSFGNGVYLIDSNDPTRVSRGLAAFIGDHPELEYVSQIPFADGHGGTNGVTVIFREKSSNCTCRC